MRDFSLEQDCPACEMFTLILHGVLKLSAVDLLSHF